MSKVCEICGGKHYAKLRCRLHYKMPSQLQPKETVSKPKNQIAKFSDKKLVELKEYRKLRDEYFKLNPICEFKDCNSTEIDLHHKKSRKYFLCDITIFMSVCREHHIWLHENDKEARELGYLLQSI